MVTSFPLKGKNIVQIGNSRGIIIDASFFQNGMIADEDTVDLIVTVRKKEGTR